MLTPERLEEWKKFYEQASSRVRASYMPEAWRYPYCSVNLRDIRLDEAGSMDWILTNGLGGYSSSTLIGLNTSRYHGLLTYSSRSLRRLLLLSGVDEQLSFGGSTADLRMHQHSDGISAPGRDFLGLFKFNLDSVVWAFDLDGVEIQKRLEMVYGDNILLMQYDIDNKMDSAVTFTVKPLVTSRPPGLLAAGEPPLEAKVFGGHAVGVSSDGAYLLVYSEQMSCTQSGEWLRDVRYSRDSDGSPSECLLNPAVFSVEVKPKAKQSVSLLAMAYPNEREAVKMFGGLVKSGGRRRRQRLVSSDIGEDIIAFSASCDSFIADYIGRKTIIAGYPSLGQRARDAMAAIPGLLLSSRRFDLAEEVLENFLNYMRDGRIPSEFREGAPVYDDFDSTLWLIDSLNQYRKCVDGKRFERFLWRHWGSLKGALGFYLKHESGGLLRGGFRTWMHPVSREGGVEVQGLWYNALKALQEFSEVVHERVAVEPYIKAFEENFMKTYWNGSYLNDGLGDGTLRPNQLILLSLEYNTVGPSEAKSVLEACGRGLSTPLGFRTLPKEHPSYVGRCSGNIGDRDSSYYNGAIWPWLAGPYFRASMRLLGGQAKADAVRFLEGFLRRHLREAGLGAVSEAFDGDHPNTPRGCVSHALNSAELMRIYWEATR